jgi:hypothetical protein
LAQVGTTKTTSVNVNKNENLKRGAMPDAIEFVCFAVLNPVSKRALIFIFKNIFLNAFRFFFSLIGSGFESRANPQEPRDDAERCYDESHVKVSAAKEKACDEQAEK